MYKHAPTLGPRVGAWSPRTSETDDPSKGLILGAFLRRVRPTPGHLHGDLLAGVKIVFPEYIGDVLFHGALGEV